MRKKLMSIILTFAMMFGLTITAYASDYDVLIPKQEPMETDLEAGDNVDEGNKTSAGDGAEAGDGTDEVNKADAGNGTETGDGTDKENKANTGDETEAGDSTDEKNKADSEDETEVDDNIEQENKTVSGNEIENDDEVGEEIDKALSEELAVDPVIYSVSFPSIEQFEFLLDPYGLRGLQEGESATLEDLKPYAGKIYCDNKLMVTNKSSVPIKLKISIQLTGNVNAVETMEELEADDENNILLYIVPSQNDMEGELEDYQPSESGIVVKKDEPTVVEILLPQSNYYYKENLEEDSLQYVIAEEESGHSSAFRIGGRINTKADWKSFDAEGENVGLEIKYSYEDASDSPAQYSLENEFFGIQYYDGTVINVDEN